MAKVERSIFIKTSPQHLDEITADAKRMTEWYVGIEAVKADSNYPAPGSKALLTYRSAGVKLDVTQIVVERVLEKGATYKLEGMMTGTSTWTISPQEGGIKLTALFDYEMPGGALGKIADKLIVEKMNIENLEKSLQNLKKIAEG